MLRARRLCVISLHARGAPPFFPLTMHACRTCRYGIEGRDRRSIEEIGLIFEIPKASAAVASPIATSVAS
eukprot:5886004-Pleurochrysis_carterae.AAC.1